MLLEAEAAVGVSQLVPLGARDYLNRVMRKSPPTAKTPMPDQRSVIAIAVPPSKANAPTIAMANRLT